MVQPNFVKRTVEIIHCGRAITACCTKEEGIGGVKARDRNRKIRSLPTSVHVVLNDTPRPDNRDVIPGIYRRIPGLVIFHRVRRAIATAVETKVHVWIYIVITTSNVQAVAKRPAGTPFGEDTVFGTIGSRVYLGKLDPHADCEIRPTKFKGCTIGNGYFVVNKRSGIGKLS